jgi:predicted outer membrane repeat protein
MKRSRFYVLVFMLGAAWITQLALPPAARAGGVVGDGSPGSCTEAALEAALAGGGEVSFNCGPHPYTIRLDTEKTIEVTTRLDGGGRIRLDGGGHHRIFYVNEGVEMELRDITLTKGWSDQGGLVYNAGTLSIQNAILSLGHGHLGGAVFNAGTLTIRDSKLTGGSGDSGGGVYNEGTLNITGTEISNDTLFRVNFGTAIYNTEGATLTLSDSRLTGNYAEETGAGIDNYGTASVTRVIFDRNYGESGGGIANFGSMVVEECLFLENAMTGGGAVVNDGRRWEGMMVIRNSSFVHNAATLSSGGAIGNIGTLTLENNLFYGNSALGYGGAVYNHENATLTVTNNTFSENTAAQGGGIYSIGTVSITNSTFFGNSSDGLVNAGEGTMQVLNTLLASNSPSNCNGLIASAGYNMEDSATCGFTSTGDQIVSNPLIGPLADNGGPTWTHALLKGSPAINTGTNEGCPATDQRGVIRPRLGACDIGAYEFVGSQIFLPRIRKQ